MSASVIGITPEIALHPEYHPEISPELKNTLKARDLSFKFSDRIQVNCCTGCFPKQLDDRDIVYINHHGEIEPFMRLRKKVLRPRREYEKSYARMRNYITGIINARGDNTDQVFRSLALEANVNFDQEIARGTPLRLNTVRKINRVLRQYDIHSPNSPNYQRQ